MFSTSAVGVTIIDSQHYSNVFGEVRNFRIFLPPGYNINPVKKYPVIYFLHGWNQRYFGSSGEAYSEYDKGEENRGDNIEAFVSTHDVIVVKPDGYDRYPDEKYYITPYNVDPVETYRQFPIYFPELITYIDANFMTIADREHRAISGLSMGGFMAYWIGGKYPHMFSAAGSFCGSTEFTVGPREFPVIYRHADMFRNYYGMKVRLNTGDKDFIRGYNSDLTRSWHEVLVDYECKIYDSEHNTCGMGEMFSFFMKTFENPPERPRKWSHIDVYPEFSVWNYSVSSDRNIPGFTILENVDERGFRSSARAFLPDGELLSYVNITITTPPVYEKNSWYLINDMDTRSHHALTKSIRSDNSGRLKILIDGSIHEIGINKQSDKPNICVASYEIENRGWAIAQKENTLSVTLLNKGRITGKAIKATLSATISGTKIIKSESFFGDIDINNTGLCNKSFKFQVLSDSIELVRFRLTIEDKDKNEWTEFFELPIKREQPEISNFVIADGKKFSVVQGGINSETLFLGHGNGDGVANPGESIVILIREKNKYWRTNLSFSDKSINPFGINIRLSDSWNNFDHVGESEKYNIPVIASDCPDKHTIEFFTEYWQPDYPLHIKKQGVVKVVVQGEDKTPPYLSRVDISGNNTLHVKLYDGSEIKSVTATFIFKENPAISFQFELKSGEGSDDRIQKDNTFSKQIPDQSFGFYRVLIEAIDSFGNKMVEEVPEIFVLH